MHALHVLIFSFTFATNGYAVPSVTLTSCKANTATVTITDAEADQIIYFRTDTAYNMITSTAGTIVLSCTFDECNIQWNEKFYIVVQHNLLYQTSEDLVVWLVCSSDSDSLNAINFEFSSFQIVENLTTKVYKPEVSMSFYSKGTQLDSKGQVQLGDEIDLVIRVTNNAESYFDISARSCFASGITLIEDRCPVDGDLFGLFNTSAVGYLSNTFSMFRPTSISGGPFEVVFTCILEVCLWNCDEYTCTTDGISRRKRKADVRPAEGQSNPSVVRGFTLTAVAEGEGTEVINNKPSLDICIPVSVIAVVIGLFIIIVGAGGAICAISYNYYCNYTNSIIKLKERKDGDEKPVIENKSEKPKENQKTNDISVKISTDSENDLQNMPGGIKESVSCSGKFKYTEHLQELEVHLKTRCDHQKPYRRTSIPVAGIASHPDNKTTSDT